jgi:hypothetical protein
MAATFIPIPKAPAIHCAGRLARLAGASLVSSSTVQSRLNTFRSFARRHARVADETLLWVDDKIRYFQRDLTDQNLAFPSAFIHRSG